MTPSNRIAAIDIFRALTMFLMIFVNDLWTLTGVPEWMEHAQVSEDRMGLSDWVFPGFLFIVGLSIPHAIEARFRKGESKIKILWHILQRSFALLVMGFYMVNLENINQDLLVIPKYAWQLLMASAIVLIWNQYTNGKAFGKIPEWIMQVAGILILLLIGLIYQGGTVQSPEWMRPHWWGILGIIGWSYLVSALVYLAIGRRIIALIITTLVFYMFNIMEFWQPFGMHVDLKFMVSAAHHACVLTGVTVTLIFLKGKKEKAFAYITLIAVLLIIFGIITRPEWGISKIRATPSWTAICNGISIFAFLILFIITDLYRQTKWAAWASPAGRSTLTCYLVPYFYYAIMVFIGIYLPDFLKAGMVGIIKSLLFAWLIVFITGLLEKIHIRLKV